MNKAEWAGRLKELHEGFNSKNFEIGDHMLAGFAAYGRTETFDAAAEVTGLKHKRTFFTRCAVVAALYPAELRFSSLNFATYESLRHLPSRAAQHFLPTVKDSARSCKQILHLAIEQFGRLPAPHKKRRRRQSVNLKMSVYLAALERAPKLMASKFSFGLSRF